VKPLHIGRQLLAVMDESARDGDGAAASDYTVTMHPRDVAAWKDVARDIERELCEAGNLHAEREGYRMSSPVRVVLREDEHLRRGRFEVGIGMTDSGAQHGFGRGGSAESVVHADEPRGDGAVRANVTDGADESVTVVSTPASMATAPSVATTSVTCALVLPDGSRHVLETERVTVGRQSTCSIVIKDTNVSREHAQFRRGRDGWTVRDLGSTNGTKINGVRVEGEQLLANGDVVLVGSIPVRFEIA
jgi:hypothetical protein